MYPKFTATTPWMKITDPQSGARYIFNLATTRRNGAIDVTFRNDSPTAPNEHRRIPRTRPGYSDFVNAAAILLNMVHRDPTAAAPLPKQRDPRRWVWNPNDRYFSQRADGLYTVALFIEPILNPHRGRSSVRQRVLAKQAAVEGVNVPGKGVVQTPYAKMREKRKLEWLATHRQMLNLMLPAYTQIMASLKAEGRGRTLQGFTKEELRTVRQLWFTLHEGLTRLHDALVYEQLTQPTPTPIEYDHAGYEAPQRRYLPGGSFTYDPPRSLATAPDSPRSGRLYPTAEQIDALGAALAAEVPKPLDLSAFDATPESIEQARQIWADRQMESPAEAGPPPTPTTSP